MRIDEVKKCTPCYIVDEKVLNDNLRAFENALKKNWGNYGFGYSVKTNSLPWILNYIKDFGCLAEVVSDTEWDLCERIGFDAEKMIFNGPIKGREHFEKAVLGGAYVNIDSKREFEWLEALSNTYEDSKEPLKVSLRVNFDLEARMPEESLTKGHGNRFGLNVENGTFAKGVERIARLKNVKLAGLHMHTNSKTRSYDVFRNLAREAVRLAKEFDLSLEFVDIGGSFFVRKGEFHVYDEYVKAIAEELLAYFDPSVTKLIVEPGSAVISTPVMYLTRVLDVKDTHRDRYAVTDGGRLHIDAFMRKDHYVYRIYDRDFDSFSQAITTNGSDRDSIAHQTVCGYTCMETDRIMELENEISLLEDDYILYDMTGGYTMSFNATFIEYQPWVFSMNNSGDFSVAREKWGIEEYLQKNHF